MIRIRVGCGVVGISRSLGRITVRDVSGTSDTYDHIVFASHGDETLGLLSDADEKERAALSAFRYQKNLAVLHRDTSVMPRSRRCWSSWVYKSDGNVQDPALSVTYWMNSLQNIAHTMPIFVTLNPKTPIATDRVFDRHEFDHPVFDHAAIAAQPRVQALQGVRNTWYCGAHLRHGFHEDGLASAVHVCRLLGAEAPWRVRLPTAPDFAVAPLRERYPTGMQDAWGLALAAPETA